jgi:oligopeptidase A
MTTTTTADIAITPDNNPLLDFSGLARFDAIKPEHVTPAVDTLLAKASALVTELEAPMAQVTWANFVEPLENATEQLGRAWSIVGHLNSVVDTPELRATYNENQPKVEFWTALGQNLALFEKYKAVQAGPEYASLSGPAKRSSTTPCATSACPAPSCPTTRRNASPRSRKSRPR